jgi:DNA-binding IclR family transcriptional regulator
LTSGTVESIIDQHGLEQYTENTITDKTALFEEFAKIRERGYALNELEEIDFHGQNRFPRLRPSTP